MATQERISITGKTVIKLNDLLATPSVVGESVVIRADWQAGVHVIDSATIPTWEGTTAWRPVGNGYAESIEKEIYIHANADTTIDVQVSAAAGGGGGGAAFDGQLTQGGADVSLANPLPVSSAEPIPAPSVTTYTYNGAFQLTQKSEVRGANTITTVFTYNGNGDIATKTVTVI